MLFALGTMAFGVPFILTQYAQEVLDWSPIQFGLASVVMPVTAVIGTVTAQAIATRGGVRRVAVVAMALTGLGCLLLTQVSVGGSYLGDLFFALLVLGPGHRRRLRRGLDRVARPAWPRPRPGWPRA